MNVKELIKHLEEYDSDTLVAYDLWLVEDVECRAEEFDIELTREQCENVLNAMEHYKDANIGLSWAVVDVHIDSEVDCEGCGGMSGCQDCGEVNK